MMNLVSATFFWIFLYVLGLFVIIKLHYKNKLDVLRYYIKIRIEINFSVSLIFIILI